MNVRKSLILLILVFVEVFTCSCVYSDKLSQEEPPYTLSEKEKDLVSNIYLCKNIWEYHNGKPCTSIRYVEKNGYKFLICGYKSSSTGVDLAGEPIYASIEIKYTILDNSMHEATLKEYGSSDYGIVSGMFSYDSSADSDDKKLALSKAIANKSNVIYP